MRVLITGADGRLARAVMAALPDGSSVVAVDSRFSAPLPQGIETREGDIRDPELVATLLEGVEVVLHLAPLAPPSDDESTAIDMATRGTYLLFTRALDVGVRQFVLGSTLELFDRLPAKWEVSEEWCPRPEPRIEHLSTWLAELSAREVVRGSDARAICLRFGRLVDDAEATALPYDPRWLHLDDAVAGVQRALTYTAPSSWASLHDAGTGLARVLVYEPVSWSVFHITAAGKRAKIRLTAAGTELFGYQPVHDFGDRAEAHPEGSRSRPSMSLPQGQSWHAVLAPRSPLQSRLIRNIVIFGAGGPLAAGVVPHLTAGYKLRLTDVRPIEEIAAEGPRRDQPAGAPVPVPLGAPHEQRVVDVTDLEQVKEACAGMDAIVNCTVIRHDQVGAFRVNTLGAYNIARAAVEHGIRRIVQTGPQLVTLQHEEDYTSDYDIPAEAPPRPGRYLYGHSKFLGQEIIRVFADYYGLEVPVLLFNQLAQPDAPQAQRLDPFAVSWRDAARAIHRAIELPTLPRPFEVLNVGADLPHGRYTHRRATEILGWQARDDMRHLWSAPD
ncbi:MAG TPA: NAD-dependent epimerase/dehydratase family protein [Herpetosiphonaceae bacterium]|nr:NAD-dependent epimerase/dehydratase family protein [Herpetosiphonaceae bacterium]